MSNSFIKNLINANKRKNSTKTVGKKAIKLSKEGSSVKKTVKKQSRNYDVIKSNLKNARYELKIENSDKKSFALIIHESRILTLNEMLAILQREDWELFNYKKFIHTLMKSIIKDNNFPIFDGKKPLRVTYYRQSSRFIDNDSLPPSFKYFLDAFVENKIICDDNPNVIYDLKPIQVIGKDKMIGIKVEEMEVDLDKPFDIYKEWGFTQITEEEIKNDLIENV